MRGPHNLWRLIRTGATFERTGAMKVVGNPIKLTAFDDPKTRVPSPNLDQDRDRILKELGL